MNKQGIIGISGVAESRTAFMISEMITKEQATSLIIVASEPKARKLADDLTFFLPEKPVYVMPAEDQVFLRYEAKNHDRMIERLNAIRALRTESGCVVIAPSTAAVRKTLPHQLFESEGMRLSLGDEWGLLDLVEKLVALGYERMGMVDGRGEFSLRGGILDIFTIDAEHPTRIEFFDTEIDSIRSFDEDTQRSIGNLQTIEIGPAKQIMLDRDLFSAAEERISKEYTAQAKRFEKKAGAGSEEERVALLQAAETLRTRRDELCEYISQQANIQLLENYLHYFYEETEYLWDYVQEGRIFVADPDRILEVLDARTQEMKQDLEVMLERGEIVPKDTDLLTGRKDFLKVYEGGAVCVFSPLSKRVLGVERFLEVHNISSMPMMNFNGKMQMLASEVKSYQKRGYRMVISAGSAEKIDNLKEFLEQNHLLSDDILFQEGILSQGFVFPERRLCYISDNDIFGKRQKLRKKRNRTSGIGEKLQSFTELSVGDFVVHEGHGIGKFEGIQPITVQEQTKDYLKIKYAGNDLLYVPVEQFDLVQKYIGADGVLPKINRLSGADWKLTKAKARKAITEMTEELVQLYAERELEEGYAFSQDTEWQREFEESFPYAETEDQLRCAAEIKADMERHTAMDRLLCGDVGFGKTEVAARALFKCIAEGKQAAVLVPTTVLANQHYYTLKERFERFPIKVAMLSRFRSEAQQKKTLQGLKEGSVDLIIGTHRLLSKDVEYKDLGLLVVDEEHRFGVAHKEALKKLKKNVDVLTLSATPIPRTLNMSLTGIKDMSVIEEPPEERYPVQTYVMEQDPYILKTAITRELERGGQCFVIYNRVRGIQQVATRIQQLVPDARIVVGHGRMNEHALEEVMLDFVEGRADILISTTIVESGIDIPNANTLIILDADRYGLAQLYQLRGRVGRSNRLAYAYLMHQGGKVLTEVAEKRLRTIREFTEFGSGFKVAMRDLEIRGAGNLLGSEQSGQLMSIGYELYCKMVEDAVKRLKRAEHASEKLGEPSAKSSASVGGTRSAVETSPVAGEAVSEHESMEEPEETSVEIVCSANIPGWYIEEEEQKLAIYQKIARIRTPEQEDDLLDELVDRYGDVPKETMNLLKIAQIRGLSTELMVARIYEKGNYLFVTFGKENPLTPIAILSLMDEFGNRAFIHAGAEPYLRIPTKPEIKLTDCIQLLKIIKNAANAQEGEPVQSE